MMILLVTYDLKSPADYEPLYRELKKASAWAHYLDSAWLLISDHGPEEWRKRLVPHLKEDDTLLVVQIDQGQIDGYLPSRAWEWLQKHLSRAA